MLSILFSILKPLFKSLNNTKLVTLSKAIACVALGLRVCHLVDIAHLDLKKAESLLTQLRKHCRSLVLIQFKDRYTFIGNRMRLKQYIDETLKDPQSLVYVAVDGKEPVKTNDPPKQLIAWLQYKLQPFILAPQQPTFYSDILPTCMVAMTGWALEYPVIYTTHEISDKFDDELDEWEQRPNCLGDQPLQLVEYYLGDHMLLSYSYPMTVIDNNEFVFRLKDKVDQRLEDLNTKPDWLRDIHCTISREQIKLDRFAL